MSHAIDRVLQRDAETEKDLYETLQALAADPLMVPHLQRLMLAAADDQDALRRAWSRFRKDYAGA